ncbi:UNVERIFIED_CONTAM: hypothetical protein RMT77_019391 [Armadillidium vulgare]
MDKNLSLILLFASLFALTTTVKGIYFYLDCENTDERNFCPYDFYWYFSGLHEPCNFECLYYYYGCCYNNYNEYVCYEPCPRIYYG